MKTIHLKASSKKNMIDALRAAGFLFGEDGQLITATHMTETSGYFISMVGAILAETGIMLTDDGGNEYPEMEAIQGYHANLRCNNEGMLWKMSHLIIDVNSPSIAIA